MQNNTFLTDVSEDSITAQVKNGEFEEVMKTTDTNVEYFTGICDSLVEANTKELDSLMIVINENAIQKTPTDADLERYVLELSNMLYFIGAQLEAMGVRDDLSKLAARQVYNDTYIELGSNPSGKKPTVAELTASSEAASRYESIMNNIYSRAYRQIKYKVDAAYEMLSSLRKIISKRMQEIQLSMQRVGDNIVVKNYIDSKETF